MKKPWFSLSVFCAVFFGIIIFCVIFGGYSSLYRAQNRIGAAKELITAECQKRLDILPELIAIARKTKVVNNQDSKNPNQASLNQLGQTASEAKTILTRINSMKKPLEKELIWAFEQSQVRLSQEIIGLISGLKKDEKLNNSPDFIALEKKFNKLEITVFYNGTIYNKEARYFNTRKAIFPGIFIAKLFGLEKIHYLEITTNLLKPEELRS